MEPAEKGKPGKDKFLEEIDTELRSVGKRIRKVISEAEILLKDYRQEGQESQEMPERDDDDVTNSSE